MMEINGLIFQQKLNKNNNAKIKFDSNCKSSKYPSLDPIEFQHNSNYKILIFGETNFNGILHIADNIEELLLRQAITTNTK